MQLGKPCIPSLPSYQSHITFQDLLAVQCLNDSLKVAKNQVSLLHWIPACKFIERRTEMISDQMIGGEGGACEA
jgi:hypothetical protein